LIFRDKIKSKLRLVMIGKTLIYLALEIRAFFLCAKTSAKAFISRSQIKKSPALRIFLVLFIFYSFNFEILAQSGNPSERNCDPGERFCQGKCQPARNCRPGVPPPPGLPLDSKIPFLIIAGLGLGIYYVRSLKKS